MHQEKYTAAGKYAAGKAGERDGGGTGTEYIGD